MSPGLFSLPNQLTFLRLLLLVPLAYCIEQGMGLWACAILALAGISDMADGWIARRYSLESDLGKLMDPLADKVLVCVVVLYLLVFGPKDPNGLPVLSPLLGVLVLAREFLVSGLRAVAASTGLVMAASRWGKAKTVLQFLGLAGFLYPVTVGRFSTLDLSLALLWVSVALSYWSMGLYTRKVYRLLIK